MRNKINYVLILLLLVSLISAQSIVRAEYFIDSDPGFGQATAVSISSGNSVDFNFGADISGLYPGFHVLYVRTADDAGQWNAAYAHAFLKMDGPVSDPAEIQEMEYFIDYDPGLGQGQPVDISGGTDITANYMVNFSSFEAGFHTLYTRVRNAEGQWTHALAWPFIKQGEAEAPAENIVYQEYFVDQDPGFGNGTAIAVTAGQTTSSVYSYNLNLINPGFHTLYHRVRDVSGVWSIAYAQPFFKAETPAGAASDLAEIRYYFYQNSAAKPLHTLAVTEAQEIELTFDADENGINLAQPYNLFVYAVDTEGRSSVSYVHGDLFSGLDDPSGEQPLIPTRLELTGNYPNPFNPSTRIRFGLPQNAQIRLVIFNLLGEKVRTLVDASFMAGFHELTWDGMNENGQQVSSGLYLYKLEADQKTLSGRMLLVR